MSLTHWNPKFLEGPDKGNLTADTFYYEQDKLMVMNQTGVHSVGLLNYKFRNESITVFAAKHKNGRILPLVALPCPPWYPDTRKEAIPGNILGEEAPDDIIV